MVPSKVRAGWKGQEELTAKPVPGDMLSSLQEIGIEVLREVDDEVLARCPAHLERTGKEDAHPSWSINIDSGLFNCFSCGFTGTFVDLLQYKTKMDRGEAVSWTRKRGGVEKVRRVLATIDTLTKEDTTKVLNEASLALFTDPPQDALAERNLTLESAQFFGVLWDPKQDMWIIPVRDADTNVLMGWQEKAKRHFRNQPYGLRKSDTLFGIKQLPTNSTAVLLESPLDVLRLHAVGIPKVAGVSSFGSGVSKTQMGLILNATQFMIIGFDNDADGIKHSLEVREKYSKSLRMRMRMINYQGTDAKDIGEMTDDEIRHAVTTSYSSVVARK